MTMMSLLLLLLLLLSSSMQLVSMLDRAVAGKQPVSFRTAMSGVHFKVAAMHVSWSLSLSLSLSLSFRLFFFPRTCRHRL